MIGSTQTLTIGSLTLTLTAEHFDGSEFGGVGYKRTWVAEHLLSASQSFWGASLVDGPYFAARYQFSWALTLWRDEAFLLEAIIQAQQEAGKGQSAIAVRLIDQRLPLVVKSPRTRAKAGTTGLTAPTGREVIWPQFDVLLTPAEEFVQWFGDGDGGDSIYKVRMDAMELDLVPVTEDVA